MAVANVPAATTEPAVPAVLEHMESRVLRSGSSSPAASPTSRPSRRTWSGACWRHSGGPGARDGSSSYFRLSTRSIDQSLASVPADPVGREPWRQVIAGAYLIRRAGRPAVTLTGMGALMPEVLHAAGYLEGIGIGADVVCVTSADRLYRACRARQGVGGGSTAILDQVHPPARATAMVTALDGHPHTLAFLPSVNRVPRANLGVTEFGQTGTIQDLYREHGIDGDAITAAAIDLVERG